jgi:tetratricopeptide (TPR) repeat protein
VNKKFIPIIFDQDDKQYIPTPLQPATFYDLSTDAGYDTLYRRLTDQHDTPAPPLGERRVLKPRPRQAFKSPARPPVQPTANLVHPYALQANFTGRDTERKQLTAWLTGDARPICAIIAIGGMGKSALAWYWLKNDVLAHTEGQSASPVDAVMWWSFYEGESSFARFVDDAYRYVSGIEVIDMEHLPTTYDRAQELQKLLQEKRVLFVLDGFERQLRAYARLDAAYLRDETVESSGEDRACVDPITARWLTYIASGTTRAKVLLTTRMMVRNLEDRAGDALDGVLKRELTGLPRDDALKFMRVQGVTKGTPAEIANVCEAYGNHPLSLRLLSRLIARDKRTPGDIAAAPRHDVHDDLVQRQHHVLEQSYNALPEEERALLSRIAAFRSRTGYDTLLIFNDFGDEEKFGAALDDLQERGLLQRDMKDNLYDLHPLVRHYAYKRLADKTSVHTRLRDHFAGLPMPHTKNVQSIEELAPVIELYHHTASAGQYDEACNLLQARLVPRPLHYQFGAYQLMIELLRGLFPDGENQPPRLNNERARSWVLSALASAYSFSGQLRRSVTLYQLVNTYYEGKEDKKNLGVILSAVASVGYIPMGELAAAEQSLRRVIELTREMKYEIDEAIGHQELGLLLAYCGAFDESAREMGESPGLEILCAYQQPAGMHWAYRALRALLMGDIRTALEAARKAHSIATSVRAEYDRIIAEWLLGAALIAQKDLNAAETHLTEALVRCRRINAADLEPDILLAWAHWYRARNDAQEAKASAEEALAIADRCEFRLKQAEIHNFLARLALEAGNNVTAREHAEIARERAWCDGPPHCYKTALDEAEAMLKVLEDN